jgi:hypothetical protein
MSGAVQRSMDGEMAGLDYGEAGHRELLTPSARPANDVDYSSAISVT